MLACGGKRQSGSRGLWRVVNPCALCCPCSALNRCCFRLPTPYTTLTRTLTHTRTHRLDLTLLPREGVKGLVGAAVNASGRDKFTALPTTASLEEVLTRACASACFSCAWWGRHSLGGLIEPWQYCCCGTFAFPADGVAATRCLVGGAHLHAPPDSERSRVKLGFNETPYTPPPPISPLPSAFAIARAPSTFAPSAFALSILSAPSTFDPRLRPSTFDLRPLPRLPTLSSRAAFAGPPWCPGTATALGA
jgi:hypothetical protein